MWRSARPSISTRNHAYRCGHHPENEVAAISCRVCSYFCYGLGPDPSLPAGPDRDWPEQHKCSTLDNRPEQYQGLINALSLTTPALSRVFRLLYYQTRAHLSVGARTASFSAASFIRVTLTCSARLRSSTQCCPPNISSITIDHDELFELPVLSGRRVA